MTTIFDRIWEVWLGTGTSTITLGGAKTGYRAFSVCGDGTTSIPYCISDGTNFEIGLGTYTLSGNTLSRASVFTSTNSNALVNFPAGNKDVFLTMPASYVQQVVTSLVVAGGIVSGNIASGSISNLKMASGAINSGHVASGAILGQAAGGAFTIASGSIARFDMASGAINSGHV